MAEEEKALKDNWRSENEENREMNINTKAAEIYVKFNYVLIRSRPRIWSEKFFERFFQREGSKKGREGAVRIQNALKKTFSGKKRFSHLFCVILILFRFKHKAFLICLYFVGKSRGEGGIGKFSICQVGGNKQTVLNVERGIVAWLDAYSFNAAARPKNSESLKSTGNNSSG